MNYFDINEERLAKILTESPRLYNILKGCLQNSENLKIINPTIDFKESLRLLEKANKLARNRDYFIFASNSRNNKGVEIYQEINEKMILTKDLPQIYSIKEAEKFLQDSKISIVYTCNLPLEGYCGLLPKDNNFIERQNWNTHIHGRLQRIEVIVLDI